MHILFLNQYFPPDPAPTGIHMYEVAEWLQKEGHFISFISAKEIYRSRKRYAYRWLKDLRTLARIFFRGLFHPRPDVVISATSPPCLLLIATLIAIRHRAKSIHWGLDIYPELAVKLGELKEGIVANVLRTLMLACYRSCAEVVALDEDMERYFCRLGIPTKVIYHWAFRWQLTDDRDVAHSNDTPWTWMYSGNLGRAHEWETLLKAQANIESQCSDIRLVFQGGGPAWSAAQRKAQQLGLRNCIWRPYVPEESQRTSLLQAHCCVATQCPSTVGLLWPSKLALLLDIPRPILWIGPKDSAIARKLNSIPNTGVFAPGEEEAVADWLLKLRHCPPTKFQKGTAAANRERSLAAWGALVNRLDPSRTSIPLPALG